MPPKPKRPSEAQRLMESRLEEYNKKREQRVLEKQKKEEEERERKKQEAARLLAESEARRKQVPRAISPKKPRQSEEEKAAARILAKAKEEQDKKKAAQDAADKEINDKLAELRAAKEVKKAQNEELAKKKAAKLAKKKAAEELAQKKAAEEQAKKQAIEEQAKKKAAEEQAKKKAAEDQAKEKAAEEQAKKKAAEDQAKKKAAKEQAKKKAAEEQAKKKAAEEQAKIMAAEEQAKKKAAEEQAKKMAAEQAKKKAAEEQAKKKAAEALAKKNAAEQARKKAVEEEAKMKAAEEQAQKKAEAARLQKWKEQEEKRKAEAAKKGGPPPVERVPKLSALLAMGGPEAEEYKKRVAAAKLATWKSNAGDRWEVVQHTFEGVSVSEVTVDEDVTGISVEEAVETFHNNPEKYLAMLYQQGLKNPEFTFILRSGTVAYDPKGIRTDGGGSFVIWQHMYKRLEPLKDNVLPAKARDKYTDTMTFAGQKLHTDDKNKPLLPGRGMGIGDEANMGMIGEFAQPAHVRQGACVGDCWLLSAIACLADFDWAVKRLFRKTKPSIENRPHEGPNQYTVTLWDLKTWKEVDVVVDERLPVRADGSGFLLGAKPSKDGKFWVPYLEKAIAMHCGGYTKICGGNCTDAWPMMTGSRNQFVIAKNPKTGKYTCNAKYNPQTQKWTDHTNSPHDHNPANWKVDWPTVGGGGDSELELTEDELYQRVVIWDENNFLIGAATSGQSDKQSTDGIVDNHAYSVIDSRQNICGTGIDLLLIRNPWGEGGELKNGKFMRSGPGWKKYPEIKKELNPSMEDNGLCWVMKQEFFKYFPVIYVCAFNMTQLKDPKYVNDLKDNFKRQPKAAPKKKVVQAATNDDFGPIHVNKTSDPSSPYKIVEQTYNGGVVFSEINADAIKGTSIAKGVDEFRANPEKYLAIHYQKNMVEEGWPAEMHQFTYIYRKGTEGLEVDVNPNGKRTLLTNVLR